MKYKGYTGVAEFDEDAGVLFGHVIGLRDTITFQGESVAEMTQAFHDSVDDYLEFCESRGESPEKPYSGQFLVRIQPELHRDLAITAESEGVSLNSLVEAALHESTRSGREPKKAKGVGRAIPKPRSDLVAGKELRRPTKVKRGDSSPGRSSGSSKTRK